MQPPPFFALLRMFLGVLCVSLVVMGIFSKRGFLDLRRMTKQNEELAQKLISLSSDREKWAKQVVMIEGDMAEQERVVRAVLGYVLPNEVVIEFD